mgnify:CR=1 FL=1
MKLTNRLGLPSSIATAVANDTYSAGDAHISVTGLLSPARKRALELRHRDEITEDVADRIWSLIGQIGHGILERSDSEALTERRYFVERYGWRISGQTDRMLIEQGILQDYKFSSTYTVRNGIKPEWTSQVNLYALLLRENGYYIERGQIVLIFRDWQRAKAAHSPDYPQQQCVVLDVEMWSQEQTEAFLRERLVAHGTAQHELPDCTDEERWKKPDVWKLFKAGNKRATSVHYTEADAHAALDTAQAKAKAGDEHIVIPEKGENTRCAYYCPASPFCAQWQALDPTPSIFKPTIG